VGAPLGLLILLATIAGVIVLALTALNPAGAIIGFVGSSIAMTVVLLAYLWLDRWEPEPPRLLVFAFLWGASVAVVLSTIAELLFDSVLVGGNGSLSGVSVAVGAPLIEEAAKGLFLLVMMTGTRRNELNSLTDCLVYAGLVGAGFAWLEDILYIAGGESLGDSLVTAAMRLVMGPFAHSLFTTMLGIGVYVALHRRSAAARAGALLTGYAAAVLMHGLWNGSSLLGLRAYLVVYLLWMVPIFGLAIWLGVASRKREQQVVASKLPGMVAAGLVTPNEATWLGSLRRRNQAIALAGRQGPQARAGVRNFAAQVVALAFVRDRIDRGFGDPRVFALLTEDSYAVHAARAAAPALHGLAGYRAT
jgi:protease PrsW